MTDTIAAAKTRPLRKHGDVLRANIGLSGKRILDVGCGEGSLVRLMTREGARVTGLECSDGQINRARAAKTVCDEIYLFGYGENLPLCEESFDAVIYFNALHHVPIGSQIPALQEAHRVLKHGGFLYIQEPIAEGSYFEITRTIDDETEVRASAYRALRSVVTPGLFVEELELEYLAPISYPDVETFLERIVSVDETRRDAVNKAEASLREGFLASAVRRDNDYCFENPARLNLLRKP